MLQRLTPERQADLVADDPRFASVGLGLRLLREAERRSPENPREAERLANLVLTLAEAIEPAGCDFEAHGLSGSAACHIAEARRVRGDLAGAAAAFEQARESLDQLPPFALERATFCQLAARLRRDEGRDDEAFSLLTRALEIFEGLPEPVRAAACALDLGWMYLRELETAEALPLLEQAAAQFAAPSLFDPWLAARHGLVLCYADLRAPERALQLLAQMHSQALDLPPLERLRVLAVRAEVDQSLDRNAEAWATLTVLWPAFQREGVPSEAACAGLDLARLALEQGRKGDFESLAPVLLTDIDLPPLQREVLAFALVLFRMHGLYGVEVAEEVKDYLRRARHDPALLYPLRRRATAERLWDETDLADRLTDLRHAGLGSELAQRASAELAPEERRRLTWSVAATSGLHLQFSTPPDEAARRVEGSATPAPWEVALRPLVH